MARDEGSKKLIPLSFGLINASKRYDLYLLSYNVLPLAYMHTSQDCWAATRICSIVTMRIPHLHFCWFSPQLLVTYYILVSIQYMYVCILYVLHVHLIQVTCVC